MWILDAYLSSPELSGPLWDGVRLTALNSKTQSAPIVVINDFNLNLTYQDRNYQTLHVTSKKLTFRRVEVINNNLHLFIS